MTAPGLPVIHAVDRTPGFISAPAPPARLPYRGLRSDPPGTAVPPFRSGTRDLPGNLGRARDLVGNDRICQGTSHGMCAPKASIGLGIADYELLAWDDIVAKDAGGGDGPRLVRAIATYLDLLWTGTLFRYAVAHARYFLFALFPLFQLAFLGFCSWIVAALGGWALDLHGLQRLTFER